MKMMELRCLATLGREGVYREAPLLYLALGTPPWKFKEVLEIPNLLGFPVPPWNSNTTQKSKEVWEFQGYQLISSFLGIPIPHGNSHTCKNLIKRGIGFPRRVWEIQGDSILPFVKSEIGRFLGFFRRSLENFMLKISLDKW